MLPNLFSLKGALTNVMPTVLVGLLALLATQAASRLPVDTALFQTWGGAFETSGRPWPTVAPARSGWPRCRPAGWRIGSGRPGWSAESGCFLVDWALSPVGHVQSRQPVPALAADSLAVDSERAAVT